MRVLAPGVGNPALRNDRPEVGIRQNIHPGRRRYLIGSQRNDVFAPVAGEASDAVEQDQLLCGQRGRRDLGSMGASRMEAWRARFSWAAMVELLRQRSPRVRDDGAGNRLKEDAILARDLLSRAHENAAGSINQARPDPRGDQSHDLILQLLPITGVIFVPDHQVHRQPLQTPVGMRLHHLTHEIDVGPVGNLQQDDRQVARDRVTP